MSARLEKDQIVEKKIKEKLETCPQILKDYMLSTENKQSSITRMSYLRHLMHYFKFVEDNNLDIYTIKPMHFDRYRDYILHHNGKDCGASLVNTRFSAIISFYKFLQKNDLVTSIPCTNDIKIKIPEKESVVYMTDKEVNILKNNILIGLNRKNDALIKRDLAIVTLGCSTGMRISEISNIDIDDIDFDEQTIRIIAKGNKYRIIYIGSNTINAIHDWLKDRQKYVKDDNKALFVSTKGNRIEPSEIRKMLAKETKDLNKHITPHKMRSTCAMKLYDKTGDIYLTAQQLGHSNIKNTMIYAKSTEEKRRRAADLLD